MTSIRVGTVNGEPAIVLHVDSRLSAVIVLEFDGEHIVALYSVANPDKLVFLANQTM